MPARVVVVDDHLLLAQLLVGALDALGYDALVGDAATLTDDELVALAGAGSPAVAVLALGSGAGRIGLPFVRRLVGTGCAVVVIAAGPPNLHDRAVGAGAGAVVSPRSSLPRLLEAISSVAAAEVVGMAPADAATGLGALTPRERQVLAGLVAGHHVKDIAIELGTSLATSRAHIRSIYRKLAVHNQRAAIVVAVNSGWF